MSGAALWPYALEVYGRPDVETLLLELQDTHGQCVALLLWSLWAATEGRLADPAGLAAAAGLARAWQDAAITPLRTLRRDLKRPAAAPEPAWRTLRDGVRALELDAERMLLEMLEAASPAPGVAALSACRGLERAVGAWGGAAPRALLERLAQAAA